MNRLTAANVRERLHAPNLDGATPTLLVAPMISQTRDLTIPVQDGIPAGGALAGCPYYPMTQHEQAYATGGELGLTVYTWFGAHERNWLRRGALCAAEGCLILLPPGLPEMIDLRLVKGRDIEADGLSDEIAFAEALDFDKSKCYGLYCRVKGQKLWHRSVTFGGVNGGSRYSAVDYERGLYADGALSDTHESVIVSRPAGFEFPATLTEAEVAAEG